MPYPYDIPMAYPLWHTHMAYPYGIPLWHTPMHLKACGGFATTHVTIEPPINCSVAVVHNGDIHVVVLLCRPGMRRGMLPPYAMLRWRTDGKPLLPVG